MRATALRTGARSPDAPAQSDERTFDLALRSKARAIRRDQRFDELGLDRWRASRGLLSPLEVLELGRRERLFFWWCKARQFVLLPASTIRAVGNFVALLVDMDRLHGSPRRQMQLGRGCVVDRVTWLVNGENINLGDSVKVSAFSALIAGPTARIEIGNYSILGPGVMIVAANHGTAMSGVPIRYQSWDEKPVVVGSDVWIGANAVILPGTNVGDGSIVGAGTVVSGDVPPASIVFRGKDGSLVVRDRR